MTQELDPCLHLSVQRENAGWFCQGCREQFSPAQDIRLVDDINERFNAKAEATTAYIMDRSTSPIPIGSAVCVTCGAAASLWRSSSSVDGIFGCTKCGFAVGWKDTQEATGPRAVPRMEPQEGRPITPEMVKISNLESRLRWLESDKIAPLEKTVSDLDERRAILEQIVGQGNSEVNHSERIFRLEAEMRRVRQAAIEILAAVAKV